jgi:hypothetical protein
MRSNAHPKLGLLLSVAVAWLGCREDLVQVTLNLTIPDSVIFDQIVVVRVDQDRQLIPQVNARLPGPEKGGASPHTAGIFIPRGWSQVHWRGRALHVGMVVAEGDVEIDGALMTSLPLRLYACQPPFPPTQAAGSCPAEASPGTGGINGQPAIGTGGAGGSAMADAGNSASDLSNDSDSSGNSVPDAGSVDAWTPPMCTVVDRDAKPPLPMIPRPVDPSCQIYCDAMQASCKDIYEDLDHCLLTCAKAAWPVTPQFSDGDTLTCRIGWAQMAAHATDRDRQTDCFHASFNSARACGNPCEVYCHAGLAICPGGFFPGESDCAVACLRAQADYTNQTPAPIVSFEVGVLACRLRMLQTAVFDPAWCIYAAPNACADSACPDAVFPRP